MVDYGAYWALYNRVDKVLYQGITGRQIGLLYLKWLKSASDPWLVRRPRMTEWEELNERSLKSILSITFIEEQAELDEMAEEVD